VPSDSWPWPGRPQTPEAPEMDDDPRVLRGLTELPITAL
jgi:hypothetical protein